MVYRTGRWLDPSALILLEPEESLGELPSGQLLPLPSKPGDIGTFLFTELVGERTGAEALSFTFSLLPGVVETQDAVTGNGKNDVGLDGGHDVSPWELIAHRPR